SSSCVRATPSSFASAVSSAKAGDTILLATGNYGTWSGTDKAITIKADDGASPSMQMAFTTGDQGFTLDGMHGMGGSIMAGANHITIRNSDFTSTLTIDGVRNSSILLDHNVHHDINLPSSCGGTPAMVHLAYSGTPVSGVTIQNSVFRDGNADGIQTGVG